MVGVLVLGTGRSGTSAIARAFVSSGYFAGHDDQLLGPTPSNTLGHFEPLSVLEVNEELLTRLGCRWWADFPSVEEQRELRGEMVPRLESVLHSLVELGEGAPVAIKEPRINSLLPLWQPVIEGVLHPVLAVRDPLEIAMSHARRDGTAIAHALAAWETQSTLILGWLNGRVATIAPYGELLRQPELAIEVVRDATRHLDRSRAERVQPADAETALAPDLRHELAESLNHDEYLTGRQAELWSFLKSLPTGDLQLEVPRELNAPSAAALDGTRAEGERVRSQAELVEARAHTAALEDALAQVTARAETAERRLAETVQLHAMQIAGIETSISWRMTKPLRWAKRSLRGRQRTASRPTDQPG